MLIKILYQILKWLGEELLNRSEVDDLLIELKEANIKKNTSIALHRKLLVKFQLLQLRYERDISAYRYFLGIAAMLLVFAVLA